MPIITKTYELVESKSNDYCYWQKYDHYGEKDFCSRPATRTIIITTISIMGKRIVSRIGFCKDHPLPIKYRRWFKVNLGDYSD